MFDPSGERFLSASSDDAARIWALTREVSADAEGRYYTGLERWVLDDAPARPAHPALARSVPDQVQTLLEAGDLIHVDRAVLLAPDRPEAAAAMAERLLLEHRAHAIGTLAEVQAHLKWKGTNFHCRLENTSIWLYRRTWENPLPDLRLESLDVIWTSAGVSPVIVAISVE